jgi:hypothetical protein
MNNLSDHLKTVNDRLAVHKPKADNESGTVDDATRVLAKKCCSELMVQSDVLKILIAYLSKLRNCFCLDSEIERPPRNRNQLLGGTREKGE